MQPILDIVLVVVALAVIGLLINQRRRLRAVRAEREEIEGEELRMFDFLHGLGEALQTDSSPRNMNRCVGLNNCALGCPTGAKQSMLVTEIPRALGAGARLVTNARVSRVVFERGRAAPDRCAGSRRTRDRVAGAGGLASPPKGRRSDDGE